MASAAATNEQEAECGHAGSRSRSDGQSVVGDCGSELAGHRAGQFSIPSTTCAYFACTKLAARKCESAFSSVGVHVTKSSTRRRIFWVNAQLSQSFNMQSCLGSESYSVSPIVRGSGIYSGIPIVRGSGSHEKWHAPCAALPAPQAP
jgi:hypothetical protein